MACLTLENISKSFRYGDEIIHIMNDVSMQIKQGEHVAILGPSGSGKTTLLNLISGLEKADNGRILVNELDISQMSSSQLIRFRKEHIGFILQDFGLISGLTAYENIILAADPIREADIKRAKELLGHLGIAHQSNALANVLSGGEKQRVAIARALLNKPKIILADEPTAQLDRAHVVQVMEILRSIQKNSEQTILTVTHDPLVAEYADRSIEMNAL